MSGVLAVRDLRKFYLNGAERVEVLKGVSLDVRLAESVSIMGRSGCGKSTLISLLAGLDTPSQGHVEWLGRDVFAMKPSDLNHFRARHLGIIFQQFHLLEHLNALENVRLPLDLNRLGNAEAQALQALRDVGLGERAYHRPDQLSRGECQRVAIARVLVMQPQIVLADEPTGSLDVQTGQGVLELLLRLTKERNMTLIMVTHDPQLAAKCSRTLHMQEGHLQT